MVLAEKWIDPSDPDLLASGGFLLQECNVDVNCIVRSRNWTIRCFVRNSFEGDSRMSKEIPV